MFQVWFQNRRAKFRRNERNMLAQRSSMYGRSPEPAPGIEQPIAPRPTPLSPEYLSWPTPPYSPVTNMNHNVPMGSPVAMATPVPTSSSCALANNNSYAYTPPHAVGSSIACLRLKAREYNMHHHNPYHGPPMSQHMPQ